MVIPFPMDICRLTRISKMFPTFPAISTRMGNSFSENSKTNQNSLWDDPRPASAQTQSRTPNRLLNLLLHHNRHLPTKTIIATSSGINTNRKLKPHRLNPNKTTLKLRIRNQNKCSGRNITIIEENGPHIHISGREPSRSGEKKSGEKAGEKAERP